MIIIIEKRSRRLLQWALYKIQIVMFIHFRRNSYIRDSRKQLHENIIRREAKEGILKGLVP